MSDEVMSPDQLYRDEMARLAADPPAHDLRACAEAILGLLPPHIADNIRENAIVFNRIPLEYTLAGLVLRCVEDGTANAPILDPSWPRNFAITDPLAGATYACEACSTPFKPRRYKQRTCGKPACGAVIQERDAKSPPPRPRRTMGVRVEAKA